MRRESASPSSQNAPPPEHQDEDLFAWTRRQDSPTKRTPAGNKKARIERQLERAMFEAINRKAEGTNK